jgi:hypothetical protein
MRWQIITFAFFKEFDRGAGNTHKLIYEARQIVTQNIWAGGFTRVQAGRFRTRNVTISGTTALTLPVECGGY